ncbi:hypothetical protein [Streptomyces sp. NPDC056948]|uniref:hypothetical protein n=1 Tax=Streptomyces sp. NPDC056948 TaxID=3345975 RepID=UPI00363143AC
MSIDRGEHGVQLKVALKLAEEIGAADALAESGSSERWSGCVGIAVGERSALSGQFRHRIHEWAAVVVPVEGIEAADDGEVVVDRRG